jgi:hypothetical protein
MANRKGWLWGISVSFLTYVCGPLSPVIQYEFNLTHDTYVNAVWDCLYGIGFEIAFHLVGSITLNRFAGMLGVILWPTILFWTMAYLVKRFYCARLSTKYKALIVIVWICTLLVYVPMNTVGKTDFPTYSADSAASF